MTRQRYSKRIGAVALVRMCMVISLVTISGGGVAYAALQSQAVTLTGNTIQTASAGLQISNNGSTYGVSQAGFPFSDLIPGGAAMPASGNLATIRNVGSTALALKMYVSGTPSNLDNIDLSKVHVILTPISGGAIQNFTLQSLMSSANSGGLTVTSAANVLAGSSYSFRLQIQLDSDAVTGSIATINNIDFAFIGVAVTP